MSADKSYDIASVAQRLGMNEAELRARVSASLAKAPRVADDPERARRIARLLVGKPADGEQR